MRIAEWSLHFYRLPYARPVRWFNSTETEASFVLLKVIADNGATGVAEATLKPTWSGVSPRSIAAVPDDLLLPAVQEIDAADAAW
jgi:L-Ala-D/L-Glu epimerase